MSSCSSSIPREYKSVAQFEMDQPTANSTRRRRRFDGRISARTWIVGAWIAFGAAVIVGGVIIARSSRSSNDNINSGGAESQAKSGVAEVSPSPSAKPQVPVSTPDENDATTPEPTHRPTSSPKSDTQQISTSEPTTGGTCDELYDCISDRLAQNEPLKAGQALCSRDNRYMFGLDNGSLIWKDCTTGESKKYYRKGESGDYFIMDERAKFTIYGKDGEVKWQRDCKVTVSKYDRCLSKPKYDCPYLHLHKGGVVVLNYIDGWDWISKNIKKMYDF